MEDQVETRTCLWRVKQEQNYIKKVKNIPASLHECTLQEGITLEIKENKSPGEIREKRGGRKYG